MYKGVAGVVDREDYLTGRKIDKTFELLEKEENPHLNRNDDENNLFTGLQSKSDYLSKSDVASKMREDPLFEIKMKQLEQQKQLLKNPVKLKKLKDMLMISLEKDKHQKKKHRKKSKHRKNKSRKSKKSKHSSSDSSDDSSDSSTSSSSSSNNDHRHRRNSDKSHRNYDRYRDRERNDRKKDNDRKRIETTRKFSNYKASSSSKSTKKPLTEEEMARRRQEMMTNAEWREKTRKDNVNRLNERDRLEELQSKESFKNEPNFIKPILTISDNIEDSVRRKRFKLQRGSGVMDENFARKY